MSVTRTRYQLKIFMFGFFLFLFKWKQNKDLFSGKQERSYMSCLVLLPNRAVGILLCCKHIYFQVLDRAEISFITAAFTKYPSSPPVSVLWILMVIFDWLAHIHSTITATVPHPKQAPPYLFRQYPTVKSLVT